MHLLLNGLSEREKSVYHIERRYPNLLMERRINIELEFHEFNNEESLITILNAELMRIPAQNLATITIICHGNDDGFLVNNKQTSIPWEVFLHHLIALKQRHRNLIIILCVCEGASISYENPDQPYIIAFTCKINPNAAMQAAALIILDRINNVNLEESILNVKRYLIENYSLLLKAI